MLIYKTKMKQKKSNKYNLLDCYKLYKKENPSSNISFDLFKGIISLHFKESLNMAFKSGEKIKLGFFKQFIAINSFTPKLKIDKDGNKVLTSSTDWVASHNYWRDNPDKPRKVIKHVNLHTGMDIYKWEMSFLPACSFNERLYRVTRMENARAIITENIRSGILPLKTNPKKNY